MSRSEAVRPNRAARPRHRAVPPAGLPRRPARPSWSTELGVNRKSMYAEFGSKQGLFDAALDRYNDHEPVGRPRRDRSGRCRSRRDPLDVRRLRVGQRGLGTGSRLPAVQHRDRASGPRPASGDRVDAYFDRLTTAFHSALKTGQQAGEIRATANLDDLAAFFTMALVGIATLAKGRANPTKSTPHAASPSPPSTPTGPAKRPEK